MATKSKKAVKKKNKDKNKAELISAGQEIGLELDMSMGKKDMITAITAKLNEAEDAGEGVTQATPDPPPPDEPDEDDEVEDDPVEDDALEDETKRRQKTAREIRAEIQKKTAEKKCPVCATIGRWGDVYKTRGDVRYVKCLGCQRSNSVRVSKYT